MTTAYLTFYQADKPSCPDCPAEVALCVPSSLVAPGLCVDEVTEQTYINQHIIAQLESYCYVDRGCGTAMWQIYVSYDDEQIADGATLYASNVLGMICLNSCLVKYIDDKIGNPISFSFDEPSQMLTITNAYGCDFEVPLALSELAIGALDGISPKVADGAQIDSSALYLQTADGTFPGLVSVDAQDFAGEKTFLADVILDQATSIIRTNTSDAADNKLIQITAGGAFGTNRSACLELAGNENGSSGALRILAGNVANAYVEISSPNASSLGVFVYTGGVERLNITAAGSLDLDRTNTAGGTTGNRTINKMAGSVNFAAAATSLVVTNSLVTTSSNIFVQIQTNDATAVLKNVVPAAGSFTINMATAPTAETRVAFLVTN